MVSEESKKIAVNQKQWLPMMEMFHVDRDELRNLCKGGDVSCRSANQTQ
jgi:hypothetical protein